jgi:hypothetical protein
VTDSPAASVDQGLYASTSEYVRALIRRDQDRQQLRALLLDGVSSEPGPLADADYFAGLRRRLVCRLTVGKPSGCDASQPTTSTAL